MHTRGIHGGSWEGYSQSKWVSEQVLMADTDPPPDLACDDGGMECRVIIHRFGSLARDPDMVAAQAASVAVKALPGELQSVEWLRLEDLAADLAGSILGEARRGGGAGGVQHVQHYSRRSGVGQLREALRRTLRCSLEAVSVADWRERIHWRVAQQGQGECLCHGLDLNGASQMVTAAGLGEGMWARVRLLAAVGSGLEGAIGLCERQLGGVRGGDGSSEDAAACAEMVREALEEIPPHSKTVCLDL